MSPSIVTAASKAPTPPVRLPWPVLVPITVLAAFNVAGVFFIPDRGGDFRLIRESAAAWLGGANPYVNAGPTSNLNHPLVLLPFALLQVLSESQAYVAWTIVSLVSLTLTCFVVAVVAGLRPLDLLLTTLALTGTAFELGLGQIALMLAPLLTAAWWFDRNGRSATAGAILGLLCVLKPFLGLFGLMLLWRRDWKALAAMGTAGAAALLAGWILVGTEGYTGWVANLRALNWTWHVFNGSVWGVASRLFTAQSMAIATRWTPLALNAVAASVLSWSAVVVVMALLWRARDAAPDRQYALIGIASLLMSPLGWTYYLPTFVAPVAVSLASRPSAWLIPTGALAVLPYPLLTGREYGLLGTLTLGNISFLVLMGLFLVIYAGARRDTAARR